MSTPTRVRADAGESSLSKHIITVLGLYARPAGNWMSVAALIELLGAVDVAPHAVRAAVSRLKRRGVLTSESRGGQAGYALSEETLEALEEGDERSWGADRATVEDGWVLAVFSVPEAERERRHTLRVTLGRLGFGTAAPGVWIAPGTLVPATRRVLERQGLLDYVDLFLSSYVPTRDLRAEVATWWELDGLADVYDDFVRRHRPLRASIAGDAPSPVEAFRAYVPVLTEWRRLPSRDPGIPLELLPSGWPAVGAAALFAELDAALRPLARRYAMSVLHGSHPVPGSRPERTPSGADAG